MSGKKYAVVGQRVTRKDGIEKVTGRLKFVTDIKLPGMLHAKILRSPYAHAKVKSIDTREAERLPGVKAVITFNDVPKVKFNPWLDAPHEVEPRDRFVLTGEPRFNGDGVAAVAAVDEQTATEALKLIKVDYEELPAVFDSLEAMKPGAPQLHESAENNICTVNKIWRKGDVGRAFSESDFVVSGSFKTQNMQHAAMECNSCLADYDPYEKALTVYTNTQNPFPMTTRLRFALELDMPIRVINPPVGGAFGARHELFQHDAVACLLSLKTGKPVKCVLTREEVLSLNKRYGAYLDFKLGATKEGKFTAFEGRLIANAGAYAISTGANMSWPLNMIVTIYNFPNYHADAYGVYTNTNPNTPFRGFGSPQAFFGLEQLIDELAEKIGMDPVDIRLANISKTGDIVPWNGMKLSSTGLAECIQEGAKMINWSGRKKKSKVRGNKRVGFGMGTMCHASGATKMSEGWNESSAAIVYVGSDGYVTLNVGACEIGQGIRTTCAQMVAEVIGVPYEKVRVQLEADTLTQPWDWGSFASRAMYIVGWACTKAAAEAKKVLVKFAAEKLKTEPENISIREGRIFDSRHPGKSVPLEEVARYATESSDLPGQIMGQANFVPTENPIPFGAQFAEVEVDTETGQVSVSKIVAVHDVGKAINPTIVEGQIEGAVIMGVGYGTTEELIWDPHTGKHLTGQFGDYKIPRSTGIPKLEIAIVETDDPTAPFGAKGVGEPGMVPTAAAIANAVYDATGVRMRELPMTAERVLAALKKKNA